MQVQNIQHKIYEIRGQKVILDFDLAELYEVETRALNQAVKRNIDIFPEDFLFQLTSAEWKSLSMSSQFVMTYPSKRPKTALPLAFTEHGVTMLANVLKKKRVLPLTKSTHSELFKRQPQHFLHQRQKSF